MIEPIVLASWSAYREILSPVIIAAAERNNHYFDDEIIEALENDKAFLFFANDGFSVCQPEPDALLILFFWCNGGNGIAKYWDVVADLANSIGLNKVRTETKVDKLTPYFIKDGWTLIDDDVIKVWEKRI